MRSLVHAFSAPIGTNGVVLNGRVLPLTGDTQFSTDDFKLLEQYESGARITAIEKIIEKVAKAERIFFVSNSWSHAGR